MVGNENSGRPGGNPNIATAPKTGPKTTIGKLKSVISSGLLKDGSSSKLMQLVSKCQGCPMAPRVEKRTIGNKTMQITIPAQCKFYKKNRTKCVYDTKEQIDRIKMMFVLEDRDGDAFGLQKSLITQSMIDAEMARKAEVLTHGLPKFYTKEYAEQALKYNNELLKLKFGSQRHQHVHVGGDTADKMVKALFAKDDDDEDEE